MQTLSIFQRLPLHIAESIIRYIVPPFQARPEKEWLVLYDVSYSWRTLALQNFYKKANIVASTAIGKDRLEFPYKPSNIETNPALFYYVKIVDVYFQKESEESGASQPNDFSSTWPDSLFFPTAQSLCIDLTGFLGDYQTSGATPGEADFMWLARRIRTSMPKLQKAYVTDDAYIEDFDNFSDSTSQWNASNLLMAIFERATSLHFKARAMFFDNICPFEYNCTKLVQLKFDRGRNIELFNHITRKSADTLEILGIPLYSFQTIKPLVLDDDDQPVVYPRLQQLYFQPYISHNGSDNLVGIDKSVVLFPALRHLRWISAYSFADDALFRGNSATLEYLEITFGNSLAKVLERHDVYSAGRYPNLSHIRLHGSNRGIGGDSGKELRLRQMARLLSPATQSLSIMDSSSYEDIENSLVTVSGLQNLRFLKVCQIGITFFGMLDLVKQLPALTRLESSTVSLYSQLEDGLDHSEAFVEDAYKKHYPLKTRFRYWIHEFGDPDFAASIALASVVLTLTCPNFAYCILQKY